MRKLDGRVPFYVYKPSPALAEYEIERNPLGYIDLAAEMLPEAIKANASDELIWWLTTEIGHWWALDVARHHWQHGEALFAECSNPECRKSWAGWQIIMPSTIAKHIRDEAEAAG